MASQEFKLSAVLKGHTSDVSEPPPMLSELTSTRSEQFYIQIHPLL